MEKDAEGEICETYLGVILSNLHESRSSYIVHKILWEIMNYQSRIRDFVLQGAGGGVGVV